MNAVTKFPSANGQAVAAALKPPVAQPRSEATNIEQSRAIAEVQAMVVVAQRVPRNVHVARDAVRASCSELGLAEQAFFKFPRGGQTVSGESIHLAVELARCWGNINYGISELARDDDRAQSEMLAFAWDVQTNTRAMTSFIVPHKRDKKGGAEVLTDMRDVYENNANMGARRLREMIFRVIPKWLTAEAANLCHETMTKGDDTPLVERVKTMIEAFEKIGVGRIQVETKIGAKVAQFTPMDVAHLRVSYQSIRRGEITVDEEFPVTAAATVTEALQPSTVGNPTAPADASGGAATTSPSTPPEATQALDFGTPATDKSKPIMGDLQKAKTIKAVDNIIATRSEELKALKDVDEDLYDEIMSYATARKGQLAAGTP